VYLEHRKPNGFSHKAYEVHQAKSMTERFHFLRIYKPDTAALEDWQPPIVRTN